MQHNASLFLSSHTTHTRMAFLSNAPNDANTGSIDTETATNNALVELSMPPPQSQYQPQQSQQPQQPQQSQQQQQQQYQSQSNQFENFSADGVGGGGGNDDSSFAPVQQQNMWTCHVHASSSSAECSMQLIDSTYFHIVPVKTISPSAQHFNCRTRPSEFWETFGSVVFVAPVVFTSHINNFAFFSRIMTIFGMLDSARLKYSTQNTASDFMRRHIVCNATGSRMTLSNKHLMKNATASGSASATKEYSCYTRLTWVRSLLKTLFPRIEIVKDGVSPNIPMWAIDLYHKSRSSNAGTGGADGRPGNIGNSKRARKQKPY